MSNEARFLNGLTFCQARLCVLILFTSSHLPSVLDHEVNFTTPFRFDGRVGSRPHSKSLSVAVCRWRGYHGTIPSTFKPFTFHRALLLHDCQTSSSMCLRVSHFSQPVTYSTVRSTTMLRPLVSSNSFHWSSDHVMAKLWATSSSGVDLPMYLNHDGLFLARNFNRSPACVTLLS